MRLGIIGKGMIVKDLMTTMADFDFEELSILGRKDAEEETRLFAGEHNIKHCYVDYADLLASDVDVIYIALPNNLHFTYAQEALLHNKHVIVEKPICANFRELQKLIELAESRKLIVVEAMNIHHLPAFKKLKELLAEIGNIKIAHFNISSYSSRYRAFKEGKVLHTFDPQQAGGALMDANVYNLHAAVGLFGQPQEIIYRANITKKIDTSGIALLDYGDFKVSCLAAKDSNSPCTSYIQGDEACLVFDEPISFTTSFRKINNDKTVDNFCFAEGKHRLYYEFVEFRRIIATLDYAKAQELLNYSTSVSRLMETARKQNNIVFPNDSEAG